MILYRSSLPTYCHLVLVVSNWSSWKWENFQKRYGFHYSATIYIQEPFLGKKNLAHAGFNLYWLAEPYDYKDNHIFVIVRKDLLIKTIVENQTNLVSHPYSMVLDITKGEIHAKEQKRKTKIVNIYDNKLWEK